MVKRKYKLPRFGMKNLCLEYMYTHSWSFVDPRAPFHLFIRFFFPTKTERINMIGNLLTHSASFVVWSRAYVKIRCFVFSFFFYFYTTKKSTNHINTNKNKACDIIYLSSKQNKKEYGPAVLPFPSAVVISITFFNFYRNLYPLRVRIDIFANRYSIGITFQEQPLVFPFFLFSLLS